MKTKVKSADLKRAISAVLALQKLNETKAKSKDDPTTASGLKGRITVGEDIVSVESANMGAYVCISIPGTTMRQGSIGVDLNDLEKMRLTGNVTVQVNEKTGKLKIKGGRSDYDFPLDQDAADLVDALVPDRSGARLIAKVPTSILAKAAAMVAIKPGLKAETMRMQFCFDMTQDGNMMEVTGLDFYSYGRFVRKAPDVQLKERARFVLRAASLSTILSHIAGEAVMIGVQQLQGDEDTASVRFKSDDADIVYPTLDMPFQNPSDAYTQITSGTFDGGFTALRKNVKEALNTVKGVKGPTDGNKPLILNIRVSPDMVQMGAERNGKTAVGSIAAQDIKLPTGNPHIMRLNQAYFSEVVTLAPEVVPMRIESWNQGQVIVRGANVENGRIEYMLSQVDSANLPEEEDA